MFHWLLVWDGTKTCPCANFPKPGVKFPVPLFFPKGYTQTTQSWNLTLYSAQTSLVRTYTFELNPTTCKTTNILTNAKPTNSYGKSQWLRTFQAVWPYQLHKQKHWLQWVCSQERERKCSNENENISALIFKLNEDFNKNKVYSITCYKVDYSG